MSVHFLGRFLVQEGIVSEEQLAEAAAFQASSNRRLGELAVAKGLLTAEQAARVFEKQMTQDAPFGELAVRMGMMSRADLDGLLFSHKIGCRHLGECLLMLGHLGRSEFTRALTRYAHMERAREYGVAYLIDENPENLLLCLAYDAVYKAFARFAGIGLKVETVGHGPGIGECDSGYLIRATLAGHGQVRLALALGMTVSGRVLDVSGAAGAMQACAVAGEYLGAGLEAYGFTASASQTDVMAPAEAAAEAQGGGALTLVSPHGRMGLWVACRNDDGQPCVLSGEGG